jgi:hypothetical protein
MGFLKKSQISNFTENPPSGTALTDVNRWTDMTPIGAFRDYAKAP